MLGVGHRPAELSGADDGPLQSAGGPAIPLNYAFCPLYALLGAVLAMLALHDLGRNHLGESAWSPLSKLLMRLLAGSISVWGPNL